MGHNPGMRVLFPLALFGSLAGCGAHVREARALQPNPMTAQSPDVLPVSVKLFIYQRDWHLAPNDGQSVGSPLKSDYQLRSSAQFAVVSRDRLRFHVTVVRYDEDEADLVGWTAYAEDETGHRYALTSREGSHRNRLSITWGLYPYHATDTSWCQKPPCLSRILPGYDVYQGVADLVFYSPRIMGEARKSITLVLRRGDLEFRYAWKFGDGLDVHHYGRTHVDDEKGIISVPGPDIQLAGSEDEADWTSSKN